MRVYMNSCVWAGDDGCVDATSSTPHSTEMALEINTYATEVTFLDFYGSVDVDITAEYVVNWYSITCVRCAVCPAPTLDSIPPHSSFRTKLSKSGRCWTALNFPR